MAERTEITQELCEHIRLLLAGGASAEKAAKIADVGEATVYRIRRAGYNAEAYRNQRLAETNREKERNKQKVELVYDPSIAEEYRREQARAEEQCPGQMQMELPEKETEEQGKQYRFLAAMVDKMCREQAAMVDDLCLKIDKLNDTLSIIYRAIRKE